MLFHGVSSTPASVDSGPRLATVKPRFVDSYLGYLLARPTTRCTRTSMRMGAVPAQLHRMGCWPAARQRALTIGSWRTSAVQAAHRDQAGARMAEQGWVALHADANDQRCTRVVATAAGKRLVKPLVDEAKEHDARMLRALGAIERVALRRLLEKLTRNA